MVAVGQAAITTSGEAVATHKMNMAERA